MITAIYARKSTEQNGVSTEEKSVTRQVQHATAYAVKKGWTVSDEHVYLDDGISGAEFEKRPGFLRLMNALKSREFQALVMSEESRLGREQIQTAYALQKITDAGVQVWYYLTDQERKLDTAMDKMMASLTNFGAELEREKASQRSHDALLKKAKAFHVVGSRSYGYDHVEVPGPDGTRSHVIRRINPDEATIVTRIFEQYASGLHGRTALAKTLNAEGVPPPHRDRRGWDPSCISDMLRRELYKGVVVWNKTQSIYKNGTQAVRRRPESEWLRLPHNPDLEIIAPALWARAQARAERDRGLYARLKNGRLFGRPTGADLRSEYLLSGLAQCSLCGGSLAVQKRSHNQALNTYMCVRYHKRRMCLNDLRIKQLTLDRALLDALCGHLDGRMVSEAIARAEADIRRGQAASPDQRAALRRQLTQVEAKIRRYVDAVGMAGATPAIFDELRRLETEQQTLTTRLENLDKMVEMDPKRITKALQARVEDIKGLLAGAIPHARPMLRRLLRDEIVDGKRVPGRVLCTPFDDARGRGYEVTATGDYAGLLGDGLTVNHGRFEEGQQTSPVRRG